MITDNTIIDLQLHIVDVGLEFGPYLPKGFRPKRKSGIRGAVLKILDEGAGLRATALIDRVVEATGGPRVSVPGVLCRMKKAGEIVKRDGYFQIGDGER